MFRLISVRRGQAALEFAVVAVPFLFVIISLFWMSLGMWEYHTLAEAVNYTTRTASVHGAGCAGQTCATTVESTAQALAASAIGLPPGQLNVTLTSTASTVTCNPLTSCYTNSAAWPSLAGNSPSASASISIAATYQFSSAISLWLPGVGSKQFNPVTLGAQAQEPVVF